MTTPQFSSALRRYLRNGMLPQLAGFRSVVRLGSARLAAEDLCIAPPTLSGQLRKLGEALGVTLFEMRGKRLVPTDAAWVLMEATNDVFAAFERCETHLAGLRADAGERRRADSSQPAPGQAIAAVAAHSHRMTN
jgi:DNA-binding transcriptional LysR family regulator